ncbi:ATP-binding protein [Pedobacter aquatilis]|uniref:tetratricopeptide repeat-containing sensor histidine kinase n=1 Tax=Pedobacter aquatilis TaxID=351343 RepID=UPI0025B36CE7|nr:ATP-binding protein [Pedobacter aquatilis]MDN3588968.1 ATP-binding protein [Pedobacter aquatilis]
MEKNYNTCENAVFNSRFAALNYSQGYYREAAYYFVQEYKNNKQCVLDSRKYGQIQGALSNAGISYLKIKMTDSAMVCFKEALNFLDKNEHLFPQRKSYTISTKGVIYSNVAEVYLAKEEYLNAEGYFKKSIEINKSNSSEVTNAQAAAIKLAKLYLATGKYKDVKSTISFLEKSIDSISDFDNRLHFAKLKIDYFNQIGNYNQANLMLPSYLILKNKHEEESNERTKIDVRKQFYNLQKDYELNLLKKENQLRSLYILLIGIFSIMLFVLLYQIWRNWQNSKRNNKSLNALNKQITEQNFGLQEAILAFEQSEQENKKIMKIIAHDLRSPLGAIASLSGLLINEDEFPEKDKHAVRLIKSSATDSIKLINDLLNKEGAENHVIKESVELHSLLKYCISISKYKIEEKLQKISLVCDPVVIKINREKIWRVISNLINNAIKFSDKNSLINILAKQNNHSVIISVSDNGIGIPEHMRTNIFSSSVEIQREGTMGEKSYGLGLFISKQIIEAHGGKIWFESAPNIGTIFYVELPVD